MIVYFADRKMNIAGLASTDLREGLLIRDDVKTEDIDTGVASFAFTVPYSAGEHADVKKIIREGNYILRNYDTECEFYTILDVEDDSEKEEISVYAEDAGLDLLNEIVGEFAAAEAQPVTYYVSQFAYDTGFEIGINEISDRTRKLSWDGEQTAAARIRSVATQFDAEIGYRFDINGLKVAHKYIDFYKRRGKDIARELRLHREIGRIIEKRSIANLVTALRVTGGIPEGEEDPVTLDGVTYDDGDIYVENGMLFSRSALAEWSRYLSETGDNVGHIVGAKTYEATTKSGLLNSAKNDLIKYSKPEVTYEAEILDLPENLKIGDTVRIIDMDGELYLSARLLKMETRASERTQTATLGDYLPLSSGISDEVRAMVEEFRRTVKSRYTWYAYADDAQGNGISMSPTGKAYMGVAANRLTETPDITNPAVYTWSLIKGSTPVIDATKEGGTTTITADGEPIAEIEDGNGIASKTDYYLLADTMDVSELSTATSYILEEGSGSVVSFIDGADGLPVESLIASIDPMQSGSGDPSPTNIRPITGLTGCNIVVSPTADAQDGTTYAVGWAEEAGTIYGGTVDAASGVLTKTMELITLTGTEAWSSVGSGENRYYRFDIADDGKYYGTTYTDECVCSHYKSVSVTSTTTGVGFAVQISGDMRRLAIRPENVSADYNTVDKFKAYVAAQYANGTPIEVRVVYKSGREPSYNIEPQEIKTLQGTNNIWADCGDIASVKYYSESAASWVTDPPEPNAYSKYLWWKYRTEYTDGTSSESDPAVIGVYNQDWYDETQKAIADAESASQTANDAAKAAEANAGALGNISDIINGTETTTGLIEQIANINSTKASASSVEELRTEKNDDLAELIAQYKLRDFASWFRFDQNQGLIIGKSGTTASGTANYVLRLEGDIISFYEVTGDITDLNDSQRVAYFQNRNLMAENIAALSALDLGNFRFIKQTGGNLSLVYTG